ncbi:MAG TPA: hypothetical protein VLT33_40970 [Labilithrix sp.]|nr:hypothetical protein [Labilithrix sp.]
MGTGTIEASVEKNIEKMEVQLKAWGAKLDELVAKAEKTSATAKVESRQHLDDLKARYADAQKRLGELKTAERGKWQHFKTDLDVVWKDLEATFKSLTQPPKG